MLKERAELLRKVYLFLDLGITALSFFLAYILRRDTDLFLRRVSPISEYLFLLYIILPLWAILLYYYRAYQSIRSMKLLQIIGTVLKSILTGGLILMTILFVFKLQAISRALILLFLLINAVILIAWRYSIYAFLRYIRRKGYNYRNILIVGTGKRAMAFAKTIHDHKGWGLKIVGFVDDDPRLLGKEIKEGKVIGLLDELPEMLTRLQIDEVVFVVPRKWLDRIEKAALICEEIGVRARIAVDLYPHTIARTSLEELHGIPLLTFDPIPYPEVALVLKRAIDVLLSLLFLILSAPLFLIIPLAIKLTSPGPVFFKQERCGLNGRRFIVLKFRTMVSDAEVLKSPLEKLNEVSGPVFKIKKDPRITQLGRFLRKFSLDEIPQCINVLRGDMSIVGPRPPIPSEVEKYDLWQRRRLSMKPGITCLWQVNGRNKIPFEEWMKLDLEYIDRWSLELDMKIILKTIPAVLRGTGV